MTATAQRRVSAILTWAADRCSYQSLGVEDAERTETAIKGAAGKRLTLSAGS